jgi:hypothetical protein
MNRVLTLSFAAYTAASLLHFAHNATFLADYPNLPPSLTVARVYGAWLVLTALGAAGVSLLTGGYRRLGLAIIGTYGALGLDGFAHYLLAPMNHHGAMMNVTIWLEAVSGSLLATLCLLLAHRSGARDMPV